MKGNDHIGDTPRKINMEPEILKTQVSIWKSGKSSEPNHHLQVRPVNLWEGTPIFH